jgi:hypothetical protein
VVLKKVVWRYADTPDPGAQSVIMAGAVMMLVSCADSWDLHLKVHTLHYIHIKSNPGRVAIKLQGSREYE